MFCSTHFLTEEDPGALGRSPDFLVPKPPSTSPKWILLSTPRGHAAGSEKIDHTTPHKESYESNTPPIDIENWKACSYP